MNNTRRGFASILIAVISLLFVGGALITALAENNFSLPRQQEEHPTVTNLVIPTETPAASATFTATSEAPTASATLENTLEDATATLTLTYTPTVAAAENTATSTAGTATNTATKSAATAAPCTVPYGWVKHKIKSGETLYSISKLYQTSVANLQIGNCMGYSTRIITGNILWVPNNPTITPTKTDKPDDTNTPKPTKTSTATSTATNTPIPSDTPVPSPTHTATETATDTNTP